MLLSGKTAVVTGASRGLGKAVALTFAREGCKVYLFSRSQSELSDIASRIEAENGTAFVSAGDVSKQEDIATLRKTVAEAFDRVHILVNNAAVIGPPRFLEDASHEAWQKTLSINLNGPCFCIQALAPLMPSGSSIINVSSGLGTMSFPRFCAYSVTKAGLNQMTRSLSEEFKPLGIRVNAVDPGVMDTPMQTRLRAMDEEKMGPVGRQFRALKSQGQLKDPMEVAQLILYLASDGSAGVNGEILNMRDLPRLKKR